MQQSYNNKRGFLELTFVGVHENIIIIRDLSETHQRPINDRHALWETHRLPRHASSETDMPAESNRNFNTI